VPGTLDHVRFAVAGEDSHMQIARELPVIAETGVPSLVHDFLGRHGLDSGHIDHWLLHPGGQGILDALRHGLGLSVEALAPSTAVLDRRPQSPIRRARPGGNGWPRRHGGPDAAAVVSQSTDEERHL
jgi:predicted naringenin-chalcone synthase